MTQSLRQDNVFSLNSDPIFFSKHQLRHGTLLRYYGRRNPGQLWYIDRVVGKKRGDALIFPETLSDLVQVKNATTFETKWLTFGYLSYSAIWRIED